MAPVKETVKRILRFGVDVLSRCLRDGHLQYLTIAFSRVLKERAIPKELMISEKWGADEIPLFAPHEYSEIARAKIIIADECRNVMLTPVRGAFQRAVKVSAGDVLEFGIAIRTDEPAEVHEPVVFQVSFDEGGKKAHTLFLKAIAPDSNEARRWTDVRLDLSPYALKEGNLIFQSQWINNPENRVNSLMAVWSNPAITGAVEQGLQKVILVSIDSLRPDYLGCYGYYRNTSPSIDALAEDSVVLQNAISQSHWTLPCHMSMLNSLYASTHKVYLDRALDKRKITLSEVLRERGFACFGFTTHIRLAPNYGFARGFDAYINRERDRSSRRGIAEEVTLGAMEFLSRHQQRKAFVFLHYFDVHLPYEPPNPYNAMHGRRSDGRVIGLAEEDLEPSKALYAGEVNYVDYYIGLLLNHLKNLGVYDDSLVIITADHGEAFKEHGSVSHATLYDEVIRVPLIIKLPKQLQPRRKRIPEIVQASIDIMPTVLDVLGISPPPGVQGKSLLPLAMMAQGATSSDSSGEAYSEFLSDWSSGRDTYKLAVRTAKHKYIYTTHFETSDFHQFQRRDEVRELFDLESDPGEKKNVASQHKELTAYFDEKVSSFVARVLKEQKIDERERLRESIRALKSSGKI